MTGEKKLHRYISSFLLIGHAGLWAGLVFSWRAIAAISLVAIAAAVLAGHLLDKSGVFQDKKEGWLFGIVVLFFLIQVSSLFPGTASSDGARYALQKSAMVLAPLAASGNRFFSAKQYHWIFRILVILLLVAAGYCFIRQSIQYSKTGDTSLFFYHSLVSPLKHHAVYFSIWIYTALVYLITEPVSFRPFFRWMAAAGLFVALLFLSSKLLIALFFLSAVYLSARNFRFRKKATLAGLFFLLICTVVLLFTPNPVSSRYREIMTDNTTVLTTKHFSPGDYLNGAQFRLLQWKLVPEILTEKKAWLTGAGMQQSQLWLDEKYKSAGLYTGSGVGPGKGYLGYNTHNEALESLLQSGLPGLFLFLTIAFLLILLAKGNDKPAAMLITATVLLFSLSESVLETQYGIMVFLFLPLFMIRFGDVSQKKQTD